MAGKITHNDPLLDAFKNGLDDFTPEVNPSEMQSVWNNVKSNIPANPAGTASNATSNLATGTKSVLTIKGISVVTAIVTIVTAAVITLTNQTGQDENTVTADNPKNEKNIVEEQQDNSMVEIGDKEITASFKEENNQTFHAGQNNVRNQSEVEEMNNVSGGSIEKIIRNPEVEDNTVVQRPDNIHVSKNLLSGVEFSDTAICSETSIEIMLRDYSISSYTTVYLPYRVERFQNGKIRFRLNKSGIYEIRLVYQDGDYTEIKTQNIFVFDKPFLSFKVIDDEAPTIKFFNTSKNVSSVFWNLGDYFTTNTLNPIHEYQDSGKYNVTLIGLNEQGCGDTIKKLIHVRKYSEPYIPDVFTPNHDNVNETFDVRIDNLKEYRITILDQNNKIVFETRDINNSWNGKLNYIGQECVEGTYLYIISYKQHGDSKIFQRKGTVRISR